MHKNGKECSAGSESEKHSSGKAPRGNTEVTKLATNLDNECVFDKEWAFNRMCTLQSLLSARVLQCSSSRNFVSRRRNSATSLAKKKTTGADLLDRKDNEGMQWSYADKTNNNEAENDLLNDRMESSRIRGTQQARNATEIPKTRTLCLQVHNRNTTTHRFRKLQLNNASNNNAVPGRCVARQWRK